MQIQKRFKVGSTPIRPTMPGHLLLADDKILMAESVEGELALRVIEKGGRESYALRIRQGEMANRMRCRRGQITLQHDAGMYRCHIEAEEAEVSDFFASMPEGFLLAEH
ncbi:hypothetical protein PQH03_28830 [Ralstonia insidiosa]|jgi:hypothetical protein|uniref:Uncharacterized protein n=1 Tax=Ralstonia insidiosa TaxID=190721 RepID=A0A192A7Z0_9RALS|nr:MULTISPECIES: hypothetical protein [Ralstonia]KMW47623.1 hypothetical protein AC240_08770 [Ralstonia sp. MD27]MCP4212708.1 hypothetical protein [Halieaceae bacterium]ANJ76453.1 hypothetical protein A9Y76_28065 [Ralstonia insidiosa]MBA9869692.1 hypothetical protein [Ralstonia insidiosa]MBA9884976.1 hypothetical protein [Ralstonia pickettii]